MVVDEGQCYVVNRIQINTQLSRDKYWVAFKTTTVWNRLYSKIANDRCHSWCSSKSFLD